MTVDAVAGLQAGNEAPAWAYLRFVAEHRGQDVAKRAKRNLSRLRDSESFEGCYRWPGWGYRHKPPPAAQPVKTKPRPKKRR